MGRTRNNREGADQPLFGRHLNLNSDINSTPCDLRIDAHGRAAAPSSGISKCRAAPDHDMHLAARKRLENHLWARLPRPHELVQPHRRVQAAKAATQDADPGPRLRAEPCVRSWLRLAVHSGLRHDCVHP